MRTYKIHSVFAGTVSEECFDVVYKEATAHAHGFLYIDVDPKESYLQFRKRFNDFLLFRGNGKGI